MSRAQFRAFTGRIKQSGCEGDRNLALLLILNHMPHVGPEVMDRRAAMQKAAMAMGGAAAALSGAQAPGGGHQPEATCDQWPS